MQNSPVPHSVPDMPVSPGGPSKMKRYHSRLFIVRSLSHVESLLEHSVPFGKGLIRRQAAETSHPLPSAPFKGTIQ